LRADITRVIRETIPAGAVLDGELIVFERGRTNFAQLQRRVTAGRGLLRLTRDWFDRRGKLRYTGRTHPLTADQRAELSTALSLPGALQHHRPAVVHPWPHPLPASWRQLDQPDPLRYVQVEPTVVVEIDADVAFEHQRWRHGVLYVRTRSDMSVYDVPLLLGEVEGYFGDA
jgi:hypothetical protein